MCARCATASAEGATNPCFLIFGQIFTTIWPNDHVCQIDPNMSFDKGHVPVPHSTYPVMGLYHPSADLPAKDKTQLPGAHQEGKDAVLAQVKIESGPCVPLTEKRKRDIKDAQEAAAACEGKWCPTVAERHGIVDLTGGDDDASAAGGVAAS